MPDPIERVVVDSSVLIGVNSPRIVAGAALGYYRAYWSPWIVSEYVRNRIEWAVMRFSGDLASKTERKKWLEVLLRGPAPVVVCPARSIEGMRLPVGSGWYCSRTSIRSGSQAGRRGVKLGAGFGRWSSSFAPWGGVKLKRAGSMVRLYWTLVTSMVSSHLPPVPRRARRR